MAGAEEEGAPSEEQQHQISSSPSRGPEDSQPAAPTEGSEERAAARPQNGAPTEGTEQREAEVGPDRPQHGAPPEGPEERAVGVTADHLQHGAPTEGPEERAVDVTADRPLLGPEERAVEVTEDHPLREVSVESSVNQFRTRKFFVLRPGTLNQAIKDVEALVDKNEDGSVLSVWLMAEVDHWNNEKERLVLITDNSLLVFKYDFVMFNCEYIQRIPLNIVDRISHGKFSFPQRSLLQRKGEGVRVFWDRLREPSFTSRWNPFTTDYPYITFTYHPVRDVSDDFTALCDIKKFLLQLKDAAQKVHALKPFPGKANGVMVLGQNILIEAYVGLMSFFGNQNKLGYSMARGNIGF